jgi:hypothetical protein
LLPCSRRLRLLRLQRRKHPNQNNLSRRLLLQPSRNHNPRHRRKPLPQARAMAAKRRLIHPEE